MTDATPIEHAGRALSTRRSPAGPATDEDLQTARAVFESIDVDALAAAFREVQNVPFVGPRQRKLADAVKAHLTQARP